MPWPRGFVVLCADEWIRRVLPGTFPHREGAWWGAWLAGWVAEPPGGGESLPVGAMSAKLTAAPHNRGSAGAIKSRVTVV